VDGLYIISRTWQLKKEILYPHAANASNGMICNEVTAVLKELSPTVQSHLVNCNYELLIAYTNR